MVGTLLIGLMHAHGYWYYNLVQMQVWRSEVSVVFVCSEIWLWDPVSYLLT